MLKSFLAWAPLAALALTLPATAQVYTSSQFTAPYVQVTGGTRINFQSSDDDSVLVPIGFAFPYFGQTYTRLNISTNGNVLLAAPCTAQTICPLFGFCTGGFCEPGFASTSSPGPFPNIDDPNLVIAPFWDDLFIAAGTQVLTVIEGAAPNRTFVIEWRNIEHLGATGTGSANFQVRLSESGTVRMAWGAITGNANAWSGDIGLENADGTVGFAPNRPCVSLGGSCGLADLRALNGQVFEVGPVDGPELLALVNPPPGGDPGQQVRIGVSARNIGTRTTTSAIVARVYLSTDTAITPGTDTLLGEVNLPVVPANATRTATLTTNLPAVLMPGTYRIGAIVDVNNVVREATKANNIAVSGEFLVGPDVLVTVTTPASTGPSELITFPLTITSRGSPVTNVLYRIYLSADTNYDASDRLVATGTAAIAGRPSLTFDALGTVPADIIPVSYYAVVVLDPNDVIDELDELNNVGVSPETVAIVGPDVAVTEINGAPSIYHGQPYLIRSTLRNLGGTTARDFFYTFYLSDNQLVTATDPVLCEFGPIDLAPGATLAVEHECVPPATLANGPYFLGAIADSTTVVLEGDERNNIRFRRPAIELRDPAPDLVVRELSVPALAAVGEAFAVGRTIDNIGNAAGTGTYALYLSTDTTFDAATDPEVGRGTLTAPAFSRDNGVDQARVGETVLAGVYYVIYRLDPDAMLPELDETNNVAVSGTTVRVEASLLQIASRSLPQGTVGLPYQFDLAAVGGDGQYAWSITRGALPRGLTLDATTGRISGVATAPTQVQLTVRVTDGGAFAEVSYELLVAESTIDLDIISRAIPPAFLQRRYEIPLTAIGGVPPYVWTYDGAMPAGLTLSADGVLEGTPTMVGPSAVNFRVADALGTRAERPITVRVVASEDALRFTTDILRDGERASRYEDRFRATNGQPPYVFELTGGELPGGLAIDGDKLVGTPTVTGTFVFAVRVTDARADFDNNRFVVRIVGDGDGVRFVSNALPEGERGTAYVEEGGSTVRLKAVAQAGVEGALTYSVLTGDLPPGLTLAADGVLSGTPTAAGLFTFTAQVQDSAKLTDHRAYAIVISEPPTPIEPPPEAEGCGCASTSQPTSVLGLMVLGVAMFALRRRRAPVRRGAGTVAALGLAVALGTVAQPAAAQVPYFLLEDTAPYVSRSGTPLMFGSNDDDDAVVTLPFMFRFFDVEYSEVHVGTNGYLSFTDDASTLGNESFGRSDTPNNLIAAFWDDLVVTSVQQIVEGAAPNRIVIFQWNASRFSAGGAMLAQIWLYEGGAGRFDIRYGAGSGSGFEASLGFEDATGTVSHSWRTCSPTCTGADLAALSGVVLTALQDGGPDVRASSVSSPARVYAGTPFPVTAVISSLHQNPVGPFQYGYRLFPEIGPQVGIPLDTFGPLTLTPYQSLTVNDQVTIPVLTPPGQYRVALVVDPAGTFAEPDENNNMVLARASIEVGERRPDFTAGRIVATPSRVNPGDTVRVLVDVRNAGNLPGGVEWSLVLSPNRVISIDDLVVHTASVTLPLLTTHTTTVTVTLPATLTAGRYYFGVLVDPSDATLELSEINNAVPARDPIEVGVDFVEVVNQALAGGYVGVEYSSFLRGAGGDGTYTWALASGTLPAGLTLLPMAGEIRGTPTAAGVATFTVRVTSGMLTAEKELTIDIKERGGPLTIVTTNLVPGMVGVPYPPTGTAESQRIQAVNASGEVTFELSGTAPSGLVLAPDGVLSGVPRQRGVYDVAVIARDTTSTATRTIPLTIVEPGRLSLVAANLPQGVLEAEYTFQLQALGATSTVTFAMGVDEVLPDGLSLTSAGLIIGVPDRVGTWRFSVVASDGSATDSANFAITVVTNAGFVITPSSLPVAVVGTPYDVTLEARGGTAPLSWSLVQSGGQLPRGIRFEIERTTARERLRFLGTPEAIPDNGVVSFLATVEDIAGRRAEVPLAIRVVEPPAPPAPPPEAGGCSCATGPGAIGDAGLLFVLAGLMLWRRRRAVAVGEGPGAR